MSSFEVVMLSPCSICGDPTLVIAPAVLAYGKRLCSDVCATIDDQLSPGEWIDAAAIAPGGRFADRPEIWKDGTYT